MAFESIDNLPIHWEDHEDIGMKLYERLGDHFEEGKIYRVRFTELLEFLILKAKGKIVPKVTLSRFRQNGCTNGEIINNG